ncbi:TPA: quinolinate synthase NadA [Candidatus Micrarchaeota archaeon]|nr:quinolinate synthase NadA [Candidatus Micrarchaeota archaeon]
MRKEHPNAGVVVYVNTSAEVKAEADVCCTSANALKIVQGMPQDEILFLPDVFMARNLQKLTDKKIIAWDGKCVVHEAFDGSKLKAVREAYPGIKVLAHTECPPDVVDGADLAGGTENMITYVKNSPDEKFMLVTECGLNDRMRTEFPEKQFVGMCNLCPYMKRNNLLNVLKALNNPSKEQTIEIPEGVRVRALKALEKMFELSN